MKIMFISLGCDKNLVDTEMMLGMLAEKGYQFTDDEQEAEIVVVNTCCFIGDAKEESINTLIEIGRLKETANVKMLIAAGCLAQRYRKEIREQIPEVDVIIGTMAIDKIVEAVEEYQTKQYTTFVEDIDRTPVSGKKRVVTTGGHYAYMKIAEGCDKRCSYCIIPKVRGSYRSIPMETLLKEANTCRAGRERADPCSTGNNLIRNRFIWEEVFAGAFTEAFRDQRTLLDPYFILLSGRDHGRTDRYDRRTAEGMSLSGHSDPACVG